MDLKLHTLTHSGVEKKCQRSFKQTSHFKYNLDSHLKEDEANEGGNSGDSELGSSEESPKDKDEVGCSNNGNNNNMTSSSNEDMAEFGDDDDEAFDDEEEEEEEFEMDDEPEEELDDELEGETEDEVDSSGCQNEGQRPNNEADEKN